MRSTYDGLIHGEYFPPSPTAPAPRRYARIVDAVRRWSRDPVQRVLEVGAEQAQTARFLTDHLGLAPEAYAVVDVSAPAVRLLRDAGFAATSVDVSAEPLPFPAGAFDAAVMGEVLEHLVDPDHALEEVRRVLRPGGILVLSTPNLASWFNRILLPMGMQPVYTETGTRWVFGRKGFLPRARPVGHLRVLTSTALRELLEFHAFQLEELTGLPDERIGELHPVVGWFDRRFAALPTLAPGILAVGRTAGG